MFSFGYDERCIDEFGFAFNKSSCNDVVYYL